MGVQIPPMQREIYGSNFHTPLSSVLCGSDVAMSLHLHAVSQHYSYQPVTQLGVTFTFPPFMKHSPLPAVHMFSNYFREFCYDR